jgi:release factor glutamine methyltransferase
MRPAEVVRRASGYLERHDVETPTQTAEVLLAAVLGVDRARLYTRDEGLSSTEARRFGRMLCRRCTGTPPQHLTGSTGFRRLTLAVRPGVFVPRPETEILVEAGLEAIEDIDHPVVVDVGTGSGAVALAVADEHPGARVFATDLSAEAVRLARENAASLELAIDVLEGDLLAPLPSELRGKVDLVISNPPYIGSEESEMLPAHVRADPELALLGDLGTYERLMDEASGWLRAGAAFVVEIGSERAAAVVGVAARRLDDVAVRRDLTGRDRVVTARAR